MVLTMNVRIDKSDPLRTVVLDRPEVRNAVDRATAEAMARETELGLETIRRTGLAEVGRFARRSASEPSPPSPPPPALAETPTPRLHRTLPPCRRKNLHRLRNREKSPYNALR